MTKEIQDAADPVVIVARAVRMRGLKGELVCELLTDFPERFDEIRSLIAIAPNGERRLVELEGYWFQQKRVVLKLAGYDSIETGSVFVGYQFGVPESQRVQLPAGHFYDWELEGCLVETIEGNTIGHVREVMRFGGGIEMLAVENVERKRHLIPMVDAIVTRVDLEHKRIRIDPPEGLLDL